MYESIKSRKKSSGCKIGHDDRARPVTLRQWLSLLLCQEKNRFTKWNRSLFRKRKNQNAQQSALHLFAACGNNTHAQSLQKPSLIITVKLILIDSPSVSEQVAHSTYELKDPRTVLTSVSLCFNEVHWCDTEPLPALCDLLQSGKWWGNCPVGMGDIWLNSCCLYSTELYIFADTQPVMSQEQRKCQLHSPLWRHQQSQSWGVP